MGLGVFSLYWDNIDERFPLCQKTVMSHLGIDVMQHKIHGLQHSDWMDWVLTSPCFKNIDVFLFLDIDCFPTHTSALTRAFKAVNENKILGCAQSASHLSRPEDIYAGPFYLCLSRATYDYIGKPSARCDADFDVAQRITVAARGFDVGIEYLWPTEVLMPKWKLGADKTFGIGTTYDDCVFHLFESRSNQHIDILMERATQAIARFKTQS